MFFIGDTELQAAGADLTTRRPSTVEVVDPSTGHLVKAMPTRYTIAPLGTVR